MQTQPEVMKSPGPNTRGKGTCRKCWNALGESESCKTCGEVFARVDWVICAAVLASVVAAGGLYSLI